MSSGVLTVHVLLFDRSDQDINWRDLRWIYHRSLHPLGIVQLWKSVTACKSMQVWQIFLCKRHFICWPHWSGGRGRNGKGKLFWKCAGKSRLVCLWNLWERCVLISLLKWQVTHFLTKLSIGGQLEIKWGSLTSISCKFESLFWGSNIVNCCHHLWVVVTCVYVSQILSVGAAVWRVCSKVCPRYIFYLTTPNWIGVGCLTNVSGNVQLIRMRAGGCVLMQLHGQQTSFVSHLEVILWLFFLFFLRHRHMSVPGSLCICQVSGWGTCFTLSRLLSGVQWLLLVVLG